ncbi:MAG: ABC transporter permease [Planctomycetota bacterium]|jgi:ribose transport system permease protein|nr:ABC transporter permease [Planctomycetota bacterium]
MPLNTGRTLGLNPKRRRIDFASWVILYLTLALFFFLSASRSSFLTVGNIHSILYDTSFRFFAAIGFTLLIIMGELDLSVGSMFGFGGAMMGLFIFNYQLPVEAAIPLAMLVAGLIGLAVGFLVTTFRLNSMMVTIGVMMAVKGVNWILIQRFGGRQLARAQYNFVTLELFGIKWTILVMLVVALIFEIFLTRSRHLKQLYYIGHNFSTSVLYGLNANAVKCACFALSAALSAFGGALMTARLKHPHVTVGANLEISVITAAVIGGASIFGGRGSMIRTMLGVLFVSLLQNGLTSFNINTYVQQIILGAILVLAIYIDVRVNAKKA